MASIILLGGKAVIEQSMASTFQLYNPRLRAWSDRLIRALGLPREIFPPHCELRNLGWGPSARVCNRVRVVRR
jgi:rhamnulokinase